MTSAWKLQLKRGSFRGVPFEIDNHEYTGGRRIATHFFPYKDLPFTEDMGAKQKQWTINAFVIGENYFKARNKLEDALMESGPGVLVHPYLRGSKTVDVDQFSISEKMTDGGIAVFSITFKETGTIPLSVGNGIDDLKARVSEAASRLADFAASDFLSFGIDDQPSFVGDSALSMINSVSTILQKAGASVPGVPSIAADIGFAVRNLKANAGDLVRKPGLLASTIIGTIKFFESLSLDGLLPEDANGVPFLRPDQALLDAVAGNIHREAFVDLIEYKKVLPPTYSTTQGRLAEKLNQDLFNRVVALGALASLSTVAATSSYGSTQEAYDQRDYIVDQLDSFLYEDGISDETYGAIQDLQAAVTRAIPDSLGDTPRLSLLPLLETSPALPILYDLYESLAFEADLIIRNRLTHPGLIYPGVPLEVVAGD